MSPSYSPTVGSFDEKGNIKKPSLNIYFNSRFYRPDTGIGLHGGGSTNPTSTNSIEAMAKTTVYPLQNIKY
jgi:hypothetical protein